MRALSFCPDRLLDAFIKASKFTCSL